MPSFGASDYIHLRQESSSATLTSFLEPSSSTAGVGANGQQPQSDQGLNDAEAEVTFRDGVVLDFRPCQSKWTLFSRRTHLEKILAVLVGILFFLTIILIIVLTKTSSSPNIDRSVPSKEEYSYKDVAVAKGSDGTDICVSAGCVTAAASLYDAIDPSVDPCEDFSKYACGKWVQNNPIPDDLSGYGKFSEVRERVKKQMRTILENTDLNSKPKPMAMVISNYERCMDISTLNKLETSHLREALDSLGGWPFLNSSYSDNKDTDITDLMGKINKIYGLETFLSLSIYANPKNTSENILTIDQGSLSLGENARDYYLNETLYGKEMNAYREYLVGHIAYLAKDMGLEGDYNKTVPTDIEAMIAFETKLANITVPDEERRNQSLLYNRWTLDNLTKSMESIHWPKYFKAFVPAEVYKKFFENNPNYEIVVTQPAYLAELDDLLKNTDKKVLINYIIWRFVKAYSNTLDVRFEDLAQVILRVFSGREQKPLRWKVCVPRAIEALDLAAGALYVQQHFKDEDKIEAAAMVANLKDAFKDLVHDLDWMDTRTKKVAMEKADVMITNVGYADFILNETKLEEYYKRLSYKNDTAYFEMTRILNVWEEEKSFLELLKPFDRHKFEISPAVVNAFYSPEKNSINFPAAILQPPFFKGDFLKAVNYGAIGAVIGHEITHGFDDQGSQYDKDGNLDDWWSATALEKFHTKTKCIIDQYSGYSIKGIEQKVNGKLTQGENIADNGGVKEAFRAYKKFVAKRGSSEPRLPGLNYTNEQVFFLSYAQFWCGDKKRNSLINQILTDPHSPEIFRINGVLSNSDDFAESFKCKPGSFMNPSAHERKKCAVW